MNDRQYPPYQGGPTWGPPPPGYPSSSGPPPSSSPPPPPRRTALRVVGILAAVILGIPALLFVVAMVFTAVRGGPASTTSGSADPASSQSTGAGLGQLSLIQLKSGDCFNSAPIPPDGTTVGVASVEGVPCSSPHTRQVVGTFAYPGVTWEGGGDARSAEHCSNSFETKLREDIRTDSTYTPARIHSVLNSSGQNTVYVACVIGTDTPTTGSALR